MSVLNKIVTNGRTRTLEVVAAEDTAGDEEVVLVPPSLIKLTAGTQPREESLAHVIAEYAEAMENGDVFPPVRLFHDGKAYYASDGHHRIKAALKAKIATIKAIVTEGTQRDAVFASFGANYDHGIRRSRADERRALTRILEDEEWTRMTDNSIAKIMRVSPKMVSAMRVRLGIGAPAARIATSRNGNKFVIDTSKIGTVKPRKTPILESPDFKEAALAAPQKTSPTLFDAFLSQVRAQGKSAMTHVESRFGPIDIMTDDTCYIIAGALTRRVFNDAFVTLMFQAESRKQKRRAVIVGQSGEDVAPLIREAKRFGVEFLEFKG